MPNETFENMSVPEAAAYLRLSKSSLDRWRLTGEGPKFVKAGSRIIYRRAELDGWLENRTCRSTSEAGSEKRRTD